MKTHLLEFSLEFDHCKVWRDVLGQQHGLHCGVKLVKPFTLSIGGGGSTSGGMQEMKMIETLMRGHTH